MEAKDNPSTVSSDYGAMILAEMVADIPEGPDAIRKKAAAYLPKYEGVRRWLALEGCIIAVAA